MYALLLGIIYLAFVSLGLPDSLVGAGWPVMHRDLNVPTSYAGLVTMVIAAGTIVSSLLSERLTRRLGTGLVTAISVGMTAAALLGFSASTSFWMLLLWAIPYGLGAGAVDAALNNYVALHYSSRHMSWLHGCWGIGASISPFIMGYALSHNLGWSRGYLIVGLIQVVVTAILIAGIRLWQKVNPTNLRASRGGQAADTPKEPAHAVPLTDTVRIPGVTLMLLAFFGYCAFEGTSMLWASTYLAQYRGVSAATAARFGSLFVLGITAGRFISGLFADRLGDRTMIRFGSLAALLGAGLIALPLNSSVLALIGLVAAGLGCAPIYPSIIHATPTNFGSQYSHAVIGIQMASAYLGTTLMPPLFGLISARTGIWLFPFYLLVLAALVLVMTQILNRVVDRNHTGV
ncbi:MAG: MFS transporter [Acidipropionibacterium sp.]|nr:MFS transporter [Acidipropionibacterium sp.]